ncbi:MAG: polysaccharide pyruvyl transferase family protein [Prevotellaceae bacterium]|nr:polysaccharide pyruvyl transferase family protein [Prevotellaceae bacterium]
MKIGILTLPLHTNYGGILQAYALQTVLERMGHDVVVFDTPKRKSLQIWLIPIVYPVRAFRKYVFGKKDARILKEQYQSRISRNVLPFIRKHIHTKEVFSLKQLDKHDYNCIIVGSDQIWRPLYYPKIQNAFLAFAYNWNVKRIAYAPSFGTSAWEYTLGQTKECSRLINKFDAVSVREDTGVGLCLEHLGAIATHVLDPTMLLDKEDYARLIGSDVDAKDNKGLFCYILDETEEKKEMIKRVANIRKLVPFSINKESEDASMSGKGHIQSPVESWLSGFRDASFVVTDSFHACVFSIIFKKQFLVYGNKGRGMSRFMSLLGTFGLQDRLITDIGQIRDIVDIDYVDVYKRYDEIKAFSYTFLKDSISG